ncbi:vacuolar sorting-associated 52 A isoform A [Chlorella sorokiniana]|uniref:Vacuolar sorting-associated 52 A isoform A n=1 Tax=Chlorella sorokiniana TaxID=3076 RepID=A0A2P6TF17_CHLSO|nr:vacuolar sorting-associated 52 A isoform A [Chlorella sorokiniana]|eukprot:PRW32567.1 vacuolar sorting-associated 52 A isoform A [Chlorella sorokiniana]
MAAQVAAAGAALRLPLSSEDEAAADGGPLGLLDLTTREVSLAGLEKEIEACGESEVLRAILDQGVDPREYSRQYEAKLRQAEVASIQDYIAESDSLAALHSQIKECDGILVQMEDMLGRFQSDLGNISSEIRSLQEQSTSMSVRLKNRRTVQERLEAFIEHVSIPPPLIFGIVQGEMGEAFLGHLEDLAKKLDYVAGDDTARFSAAFRDVAPELERLKVKAVQRCRDHLMERIYDMRKPKTNLQIKQSVLLRYRYMAAFLKQHAPNIYAEVRGAYVDKVGAKMLDLFRTYWAAMERLEEIVVTSTDSLGAPEAAAGGMGLGAFFARQPTAGGSSSRAEVYALKDRAGVLAQLEAPPLVLHVAESEHKKFTFEVLFRSLHRLLMDTAAHEYLFCQEMWGEEGAYRDLFAPILAFIEASLAAALQEQYDPLAVMLMIRINRENTLAMARKRNPALDGHFDRMNLLLWPRLKALFDLQLASIKALHPTQVTVDPQPRLHILTERYAHLTASMLLLHADFLDGPLDTNIERLRYAVMNLLLHISRQYPQKGRGTVFLVTNFAFGVAVLKEAHARGLPATPGTLSTGAETTSGLGTAGLALLKEFEDSLARCTGLYCDDQLGRVAGTLVAFVKRGEAAAAGVPDGAEVPGFSPAEAAPVAADFSARWQHMVETINREVGKDFGNTPAGRTVLQAAFTQLLLYYNRFLELCKRQGAAGLGVAQQSRHPALWAQLQPAWLAQRCPEQTLQLGSLAIRNAELLPWQLAGVAVAAAAAALLKGHRFTYLRHSLLFFALMNLSSILCHALADRASPLWQAALLADVVCTGASSLCLLLSQLVPPPATAAASQAAARRCWAVFAALLAAAAGNLRFQLPWVPEAIYLGTTALAATVTSHRLAAQWRAGSRPGQLPLLLLAASALSLIGLCLPLDPLLCPLGGPWLGTVPLLFLGSDLGFVAVAALEAAGTTNAAAALRRKAD